MTVGSDGGTNLASLSGLGSDKFEAWFRESSPTANIKTTGGSSEDPAVAVGYEVFENEVRLGALRSSESPP